MSEIKVFYLWDKRLIDALLPGGERSEVRRWSWSEEEEVWGRQTATPQPDEAQHVLTLRTVTRLQTDNRLRAGKEETSCGNVSERLNMLPEGQREWSGTAEWRKSLFSPVRSSFGFRSGIRTVLTFVTITNRFQSSLLAAFPSAENWMLFPRTGYPAGRRSTNTEAFSWGQGSQRSLILLLNMRLWKENVHSLESKSTKADEKRNEGSLLYKQSDRSINPSSKLTPVQVAGAYPS